MPILDLTTDRRVLNVPPPPLPVKQGKRALSSQNTPAAVGMGRKGGFAAAAVGRLTGDLTTGQRSADQDLYGQNTLVRGRARQLALNSPFIKKFLAMVAQNVIGPDGIPLQAKLLNQDGNVTAETKRMNLRIEQEWAEWCEVGNCTADGRFSFVELMHMALKNVAREGENLVKDVYGREFNRTGYAVQPLDNDQLDDAMMMVASNGNQVRMGVEVSQYRRPTAYWLYDSHPGDSMPGSRERKRIPAEFITHTAIWERPGQTRGYSWTAPVVVTVNHYDGMYEATLVAARSSAAKFAVIQQAETDVYGGEDEDEDDEAGTNSDGTLFTSGNAGEIPILDPGQTLNFTDPRFPTQAFDGFSKTCIRNMATGLLVSYPTLGNDLEGVNFSSIRAGLLDERDCWRVIQRWFIDHFVKPIFQKWLTMALLTTLSDITLTPAQRRQFVWRPRSWAWVDPVKDADAAVLRIANGFSTYEKELGELGLDVEETFATIARERELMLKYKITLGTDIAGDQGGKGVASGDEGAAEQVEGAGAGGTSGKSGSAAKGGK